MHNLYPNSKITKLNCAILYTKRKYLIDIHSVYTKTDFFFYKKTEVFVGFANRISGIDVL